MHVFLIILGIYLAVLALSIGTAILYIYFHTRRHPQRWPARPRTFFGLFAAIILVLIILSAICFLYS